MPKTNSPADGLSFWDNYKTISKEALEESGEVVKIIDIERGIESQYGPRFRVQVVNDENTIGYLMFGEGVESRDEILNAMYDYLKDKPGAEIPVRLSKSGRTTLVVKA